MNNTEVLKTYFKTFSERHIYATKGGAGTSISEITKWFNSYLSTENAPIQEATTYQVGKLMSQQYIKRSASSGPYYLVSLVTPK